MTSTASEMSATAAEAATPRTGKMPAAEMAAAHACATEMSPTEVPASATEVPASPTEVPAASATEVPTASAAHVPAAATATTTTTAAALACGKGGA
jgi:hypothetical protein